MNIKLEDIAYNQLDLLDPYQLDKTIQSDSTLTLSGSTDAFKAAELLSRNNATTIIVTDDSENVQGVVFPNWVQSQLLIARGISTNSFAEAVEHIKHEGDVDIGNSGDIPSYHHEWLNLDRPALYWCEEGEHYIDTSTCPYHR
jgi:hypothetical protein